MLFFNESSEVQPINEMYFGKTKELQEIEIQLDKFRNKHMGNYYKPVNSDPDLLKFNRMMEKYFGFGVFSLTVNNTCIVNAYTMPISYRFDISSKSARANLLVDERGFKFNKDADYACIVWIYSAVIFNPDYTTDEVMALILHEVGHNFYSCLNRKNGVLADIYTVAIVITWIIRPLSLIVNECNSVRVAVERLKNKMIEENNPVIHIIGGLKFIGDVAKSLVNKVIEYIGALTFLTSGPITILVNAAVNKGKSVLRSPLSVIFLPITYRDERNADNFATMYGYGDATVRVQAKSQQNYSADFLLKNINKIPLIGTYFNLNLLPAQIVAHAFDPHPEFMSRATDQLDLLERELAKEGIDPKMKKCIEADVKACKSAIKQMTMAGDLIEDPFFAQHVYNSFLYENCGSKTLKDLLFDDVNKFAEYDKTYDEKLRR